MSATPVHFYIYYRIAAPHVAEAQSAIHGVIDALRRRFAVSGRLLRAQDDAALWMEVYEDVVDPADFQSALAASLSHTNFASWLSPGSTRRTERFVGLAP